MENSASNGVCIIHEFQKMLIFHEISAENQEIQLEFARSNKSLSYIDSPLNSASNDTTHVGRNTVYWVPASASQIQKILVRFVIGHVIADLVTSTYHHKKNPRK